MYNEFFNLRENPFRVNPDPRYLFFTPSALEALATLTYGIQARKGIVLLTGEVGTGKTTLLNKLLDWLHERQAATAFIFNTQLSVSDLFDCLMADFGILPASRTKGEMLLRLNRWLLERHQVGQLAVLVVDEAQNLSPQALEEIRLLTNLETSSEKLLQIVLSGQPELEEKLGHPQLRQLRQRITLRCRTSQLSLAETRGYVAERPAPLIDEVAREFELDRFEPRAPSASSVHPPSSWPVEALLQDFAAHLHRNGEPSSMCATPEGEQP